MIDYDYYFRVLVKEFYFCVFLVIGLSIMMGGGIIVGLYQMAKRRMPKSEFMVLLIALPICLIMAFGMSSDLRKDLVYVKNGEYLKGTGTAITDDSRKTNDNPGRSVRFQFDDGEVLTISLYYGPIHIGDRFEIIYLPNTRRAVIVQKLR